jgi:sec-independent protein translocase protein TatA
MRLGMWEIILIFAVLLLLFGATKLPQLGSSLGQAIKNFKKGFSSDEPEQRPQDGKHARALETAVSNGGGGVSDPVEGPSGRVK